MNKNLVPFSLFVLSLFSERLTLIKIFYCLKICWYYAAAPIKQTRLISTKLIRLDLKSSTQLSSYIGRSFSGLFVTQTLLMLIRKVSIVTRYCFYDASIVGQYTTVLTDASSQNALKKDL